MHGLSPAPFAVLFELDLAHNQLLVFAGPIVNTLAFAAGEFYKAILRHEGDYTPESLIVQSTAASPRNRN